MIHMPTLDTHDSIALSMMVMLVVFLLGTFIWSVCAERRAFHQQTRAESLSQGLRHNDDDNQDVDSPETFHEAEDRSSDDAQRARNRAQNGDQDTAVV